MSDTPDQDVPPDEYVASHLHLIERDPRAEPEGIEWDPALIPDPSTPPSAQTEQQRELYQLIKSQPILDIYRRFCGKAIGRLNGAEVQVSCPNPEHPDANPSASINVTKNTGCCYACDIGFDVFDIYAWHSGYMVPDYKDDGTFPMLCDELGLMLGYTVHREGPVEVIVATHEPEPEDPNDGEDEPDEPEDRHLTIVRTPADMAPEVPLLDFLDIFDERSQFIRPFVERLKHLPFPNEYHGWLALMAVGFALGNKCRLEDFPPVRGNLLVCLVGGSGAGKSTAAYPFRTVLHGVPVRAMGIPNSAEALLDLFCDPIDDPSHPGGKPTGYKPVRGLVTIPELSSLITRGTRAGNDVKSRIMDLYDSDAPQSDHSRANGNDGRKGHAEDHFLQVFSTTQPDRIVDLLTRADKVSGFLNRWIFATGTPKPGVSDVWRGCPPDMTDLAGALKGIYQWAYARPLVGVDVEARNRFEQWATTEFRPHHSTAIYGRVELTMKKLMLLIAADKREQVVTVDTVEQALAFWPYLRASYGAIDVDTETYESREQAQKAVRQRLLQAARLISEDGRNPSQADIKLAVGRQWWERNLAEVESEWRRLVNMGLLRALPPQTGKAGRPTIRYAVEAG